MHLLLISNRFPPQELGGYGRCMADFAWGLEQRGHRLSVLCSDAPYLPQPVSDIKLAAPVDRRSALKGHFRDGVHHLLDPQARRAIDAENRRVPRSTPSTLPHRWSASRQPRSPGGKTADQPGRQQTAIASSHRLGDAALCL